MTRHRFAVVILVSAALLTLFNVLLEVPGMQPMDLGKNEKVIADAGTVLPKNGTVGYWTDLDATADPTVQQMVYYQVQYALAPRVVVKSLGEPFLLVYQANPQSHLPGAGMALVKDFGTGFKVFQKKSQ